MLVQDNWLFIWALKSYLSEWFTKPNVGILGSAPLGSDHMAVVMWIGLNKSQLVVSAYLTFTSATASLFDMPSTNSGLSFSAGCMLLMSE